MRPRAETLKMLAAPAETSITRPCVSVLTHASGQLEPSLLTAATARALNFADDVIDGERLV
jgi:hypothetical protein